MGIILMIFPFSGFPRQAPFPELILCSNCPTCLWFVAESGKASVAPQGRMTCPFGINLDKCFSEVQRSNMSKLDKNGKPIFNENGKVMKGPNYSEPNLKQYL